MQEKTALVKWIEESMRSRGWEIPELTRAAKIDKTAVWRIVSKGSGRADLKNINAIMEALNLIPEAPDTTDNLLYFTRKKYKELFALLDHILASDKGGEAASAINTYLQGVVVTLDDHTKLREDVRTLNEKVDRILGSLTRPIKKGKEPPPGSGS